MKRDFTLLNSAIHETVLHYRNTRGQRGAAALAPQMGLRIRTCQNKANPHQTAFYFRPEELVALMRITERYDILHALAAALGHTCIPLDPGQGGGQPLQALAMWTARQSDCMWAVAEYLQESNPARAKLTELQATHFAAAGEGLAFLRAVEVAGHA